jgi:spermidine/putrescine transport system permease protein|tara:strand:- start:5740 stop:6531 length:792 start_codon:yes stop_codon:yes gene_type:complete
MLTPMLLTIAFSFFTQINMNEIDYSFTTDRYVEFFNKPLLTSLLFKSVKISFIVTFVTLLTAYPVAYYIAFYVKKNKTLWLILMSLPFWTSYLLRIFSWKIILGTKGVINSGLITLGLISEPLTFIMYSQTAVVITLSHAWAAFALLPLYVSLDKIDYSLIEASRDLGNSRLETFWRVTFPLSLPGVIGAILIIFIPTVGDYVTPQMVGGVDGRMLSYMIQSYFGKVNNIPLGAVSAVIMLAAVASITMIVSYATKKLTQRVA